MSDYDPAENARKSYDVAIDAMREKLASFRCERIHDATLYLGDCVEILRALSFAVDAVVTDPPYCSGGQLEAQRNTKAQGLRTATVSADEFKWFSADNMSTPGLVALLRSTLVEARRLLRKDRSAFICTDWRMVPSLAPQLESSGLRFRNMIVWDKGHAGLGTGFKPAHEIVLEFSNGATRYAALDGQNVIRESRVSASTRDHNAQKPVEMIGEIIRVAVEPGGTILDPFMGSGTTGVACAKLGRRFIGIELEPKYFDIACKRIDEAYRQPRLFKDEAPKPKQEALL